MVEKLQELPELRDVASDQQVGGLRAKLVFDRNTAYRLGITPSTIDQTLYDAYGQREVSTIFTQLNQYHVVLEVKHGFSAESLGSPRPLHPHQRGDQRHRFGRIGIGWIGFHPVVRTDQLPDRCHHQPVEFHLLLRPLLHDRFG